MVTQGPFSCRALASDLLTLGSSLALPRAPVGASLPFTGPGAQVAHSGSWSHLFCYTFHKQCGPVLATTSAPVIKPPFPAASHLPPLMQHKPPEFPALPTMRRHREVCSKGLGYLFCCHASLSQLRKNEACSPCP